MFKIVTILLLKKTNLKTYLFFITISDHENSSLTLIAYYEYNA